MIENETQLKQAQLQLFGFKQLRKHNCSCEKAEMFISRLEEQIENYQNWKKQHHDNQ